MGDITDINEKRKMILREIEELVKRIKDLENQLPAHSIPPAMVTELDDLELRIVDLEERLSQINNELGIIVSDE
jgi:polyhydroxyalkanoate synthesis regulator phasin